MNIFGTKGKKHIDRHKGLTTSAPIIEIEKEKVEKMGQEPTVSVLAERLSVTPEEIIDLDKSDKLTKDERNFIYEFAVWIYRAIAVFKNSQICYNHYKQKRFIAIKGGLYASDRTNVPPAIRG